MSILLVSIIVYFFVLYVCNAKHRAYKHEEHIVEVYAGWYTHRLKIDGNVVDEIKTTFFHHIKLDGKIDGLEVKVNIGTGLLGNTISTNINGMMVSEYKKELPASKN